MDLQTQRLQREAERIAAKHPLPEFYTRFKAPLALSRRLFFMHPLMVCLREAVEPRLQEDLGHGLFHSSHVSIDSAALIFLEAQADSISRERTERIMVLGLMAGLLHDICRDQEKHAEVGAVEAEKILEGYPLSAEEIQSISGAIRNHEAFTPPMPCKRRWSQVISDCLYDADKFRWGPDTFTHTLWYMTSQQGLTPQQLIGRFPWGMEGISRILETFRTQTGRQFGPDIIETGAEIGREIYRYLVQHFREESSIGQ